MIRQHLRRLLTSAADTITETSKKLRGLAARLWDTHLDAMNDHAAYRTAWTDGVPALLAAVHAAPIARAIATFLVQVHAAAFTPVYDEDDRPW
jgi:hypothetical protein